MSRLDDFGRRFSPLHNSLMSLAPPRRFGRPLNGPAACAAKPKGRWFWRTYQKKFLKIPGGETDSGGARFRASARGDGKLIALGPGGPVRGRINIDGRLEIWRTLGCATLPRGGRRIGRPRARAISRTVTGTLKRYRSNLTIHPRQRGFRNPGEGSAIRRSPKTHGCARSIPRDGRRWLLEGEGEDGRVGSATNQGGGGQVRSAFFPTIFCRSQIPRRQGLAPVQRRK